MLMMMVYTHVLLYLVILVNIYVLIFDGESGKESVSATVNMCLYLSDIYSFAYKLHEY